MKNQANPISATMVSQYLHLAECARYWWLRRHPAERHGLIAQFHELGVEEQPLTPLLRTAGQAFEEAVLRSVPRPHRDLHHQDATATGQVLAALRPGMSCVLLQPEVAGVLGQQPCVGRADLVRATRRVDGAIDLLVADVKRSKRARVEHRLQVAVYVRLLQIMLAERGLPSGTLTGAILTRGDGGAVPPLDDPVGQFDLEPYLLAVAQLLESEDADLARIEQLPFADLPYSLGYKCDGCPFNPLCMAESAARQDVALVPFIQPAQVQALRAAGVRTLPHLAHLLDGPPTSGVRVGAGVVGPALARLVQGAQAVAQRFDPQVAASAYMRDALPSQLPADETNPDLVKIFLDAQHDFIEDRLYLLGALVVGPGGTVPVVRMSTGPPDDAAEAALLAEFVPTVLASVGQVARDPAVVPVHLYVYDSYDQKVWLDALARHLDTLSGLPAFFDLLTASPALGQPLVGILATELRERRNLGLTCPNLYSVARRLGFRWQTERDNFARHFYLRVFDGQQQRADGVRVESASRFGSTIPLEYVYAAWRKLPDDPSGQDGINHYNRCWPEHLLRFQEHRLRALAHIEGALGGKNAALVKTPLPPAIPNDSAALPTLARALEEFLFIEHYSALQEHLALYTLPIGRRVASGRALLAECCDAPAEGAAPRVHLRLLPAAEIEEVAPPLMRIKEGDWLVLNPADEEHTPWQLAHGRLAIVTALVEDTVDLQLLTLSDYGSRFKYSHAATLLPTPGERYTLDEMPDNLNFDKYLAALQHSESNVFFNWLLNPPISLRPSATQAVSRGHRLLERVRSLQPRHQPTAAQARVIAERAAAPLLCVQGPPGTGKTDTLGWAVLARLFARDARPLRVAVCARTHKAVGLVLDSIATKLKLLASSREGQALGHCTIYKVGGDRDEMLSSGVRHLNPQRDGGLILEAWARPLVVLGGTPGGLLTLIKAQGGGEVDWSEKCFDLVVIDEASQMSLPEAVLAGAFLRPDGQMIVVGDHRQLPPILAHPWARARGRSVQTFQPHRSVFESLLALDVPVERLDESFRLHRTQATFLADHIYAHDGFTFYSRQTRLLGALPPGADAYVAAALDPMYPIVVIEHTEDHSQQVNSLEQALAAPLITACCDQLGLDPINGIGVVVPHRAQKAAVRRQFPALAAADAIDTVERFQGGERDVIIVLATASDPQYVLSEAAFLLNLNRLNVALSRPRRKLIVIAARSIFRLLTDDLALFEQAILWKRLRYSYATTPLWQGTRAGYGVQIWGHPCGHPLPLLPPLPAAPLPPTPSLRKERSKEAW